MKLSLPFSDKLKQILSYSREEAIRLSSMTIEPEHIMLGIIRDGDNHAFNIMQRQLMLNMQACKQQLEHMVSKQDKATTNDEVIVGEETSNILRLSLLEAKVMKSTCIDSEHILLGLLKRNSSTLADYLTQHDVTYDSVMAALTHRPMPKANIDFDDDEEDLPPSSHNNDQTDRMAGTKTEKKQTDTPAIDTFGTDITMAAREGKLDPVVGREREIERIAQILARRKKNNPVLIGEPGVGKSAIVEGLALRIIERKVSRTLFDKRIIALDMSTIVAGTKYRGQFEERMRSIINELKENPNIIVFIDEIHNIVGAGNQAGQMDAANMMKPALARGELQCIGATTLDEYRKSIEKDGALERRFQKIIVEPTTVEETKTILHNIRDRYEQHHNVTYTEEAINACVTLAERYITDRFFPDKAIDVMDEAGSRVHIGNIYVPKEIETQEKLIDEAIRNKELAVKHQDYERAAEYRDQEKTLRDQLAILKQSWESTMTEMREEVDIDKIAETVSVMTGIPVSKMAQDEGIRLKGMRAELKSKVIAQDQAIDKLVSAIQRSRIGLKDPNRPIGTFMFLGPTGVGKTYLAKKLAEYMFGSADAMVRIDMSEYMEKFTVSRLVGAPPGYVGYEEGGMLTEKVRRKPYSIVLLDEIEKAHPDVFNTLLQMMDDGRLTDSNGRTVDFRNTVIIMTSNVGTRQLKDFGRGIGFSAMEGMSDQQVSRSVIQTALNKQFSPEFLNRIDEIITFDQLDLNAILKIIDIELESVLKRIETIGYKLEIEPEAKTFIANKGYDKQFGARPLRRAIQQHLEDGLSEMIVEEKVSVGQTIVAYLDNETVKFKTK
ncbi:MAG: ATP-dependent Clp protease ATP-binding subunit [Bacteroidaceae bacterium]|nr:ATP-dependent Clp protease ATP-binding subunit [Bacteroidaceae bacterium]